MIDTMYKPDCGYAWIVVAACFAINFIMAGLARAAGVLYIALIDTYGVSREVATTPFSLRFCVRNMSGPVVGALGQRFGIRPIVLLGGVVCGIGGILCSFAPNVTWITVAWGVIHGLGYGMCNLIHVIVLNKYFHKYKALALGICCTGDCFGTFLLPILLEFLLSIYDVKGTFLILAGISLNVVPAAMLLKSPPWQEIPSSLKLNNEDVMHAYTRKSFCNNGTDNTGFDISSEKYLDSSLNNKDIEVIQAEMPVNDKHNQIVPTFQTPINICCKDIGRNNSSTCSETQYVTECHLNEQYKGKYENNPCEILNNAVQVKLASSFRLFDKSQRNDRWSFNYPVSNMDRRSSQISVLSCPTYIGKPAVETLCKSIVRHTDHLLLPHVPFPQVPNQDECDLKEFDDKCNINSQRCSELSVDNFNALRKLSNNWYDQQSIPPIFEYKHDQFSICSAYNHQSTEVNCDIISTRDVPKPNAFYQFLKTNIKPIFLLISTSMALYVFLFISVFTIIIDYALDNNIPNEYGKYLIIAFSVTDMLGRLGFAVVLDRRWIAISHYAGLTTGLMGLFIFIIPFSTSLIFWMVSFSLCGFIQGGTAIMYPLLVEHYMEKDEESIALGCLNFYGGILMLPVPPMIGYFRDSIGSYDGVFWTTGGLCMFVGILWLLEPCLVRTMPKKSEIVMSEQNASTKCTKVTS